MARTWVGCLVCCLLVTLGKWTEYEPNPQTSLKAHSLAPTFYACFDGAPIQSVDHICASITHTYMHLYVNSDIAKFEVILNEKATSVAELQKNNDFLLRKVRIMSLMEFTFRR